MNSRYSGQLEVTTSFGKKVLDSQNANYSYGRLQKVLRHGLRLTGLAGANPILLLGMGGGSVIKTLRKEFGYDGKITAVEVDTAIIEIAAQEFGIREDLNLIIINMDAAQFIKEKHGPYGLVIVDLFIDDKIPMQFLVRDFLMGLLNLLKTDGRIIFNTLMGSKEAQRLRESLMVLKVPFKVLEGIEKTNCLFIISKE